MDITNSEMKFVSSTWRAMTKEIQKVVVGQKSLVDSLVMAMSVGGHVLVEGLPGLAKTLVVQLLAKVSGAQFSRIQFTPDLLPADIVGTMVYNQHDGVFRPHKGPLFAHFVLADEINRAPAKVHSALLQAMEEKSVSLGKEIHALPSPFLVMATQNPIESEGTYELPEAQSDRFLFKLVVNYPSIEEEINILERSDFLDEPSVRKVCGINDIVKIGTIAKKVKVTADIKKYIAKIVQATRRTRGQHGTVETSIEYGASPRASLAVLRTARVEALREGRVFVTPDDIKKVVPKVLRHRIVLSFDAVANGTTVDDVVQNVLLSVAVPK